jgi:hypothetical protein
VGNLNDALSLAVTVGNASASNRIATIADLPAGGVTSVSGTAPIASSGGATPAISLNDAGVTYAKIQDVVALAVVGRSANSTGVTAAIAATPASDAVLRESGSVLGFGTVATGGIANDAVTFAKLQNATGYSVIGKATTGAGDNADIVAADETVLGRTSAGNLAFAQVTTGQITAQAVTMAKLARGTNGQIIVANTGADPAYVTMGTDATLSAAGSLTIANDAVTYAKMQNVSAAARLLGRGGAGGAGDVEELAIGAAFGMPATTLNFAPTASVDFLQQQALQFRVENRTSDPGSPAAGELWLRTDL